MGSHSGGGLGQAQGLHDGLWAVKAELLVGIPGGEQNQQSVFWGNEKSGQDESKGKVPVWGLHFHPTHSRKPLDLAQCSYFPSPIPYSPA